MALCWAAVVPSQKPPGEGENLFILEMRTVPLALESVRMPLACKEDMKDANLRWFECFTSMLVPTRRAGRMTWGRGVQGPIFAHVVVEGCGLT